MGSRVYRTEKGLRRAADRSLGYVLADEQWEYLRPDGSPPYTGEDLDSVLTGVPQGSQRLLLAVDTSTGRVVHLPGRYERMGAFIRSCFGLEHPVAVSELGVRLEEFRAQEPGEGSVSVVYPKAIHTSGAASLWEMEAMPIANKYVNLVQYLDSPYSVGIRQGKDAVDELAAAISCHPVLVLAHFLCGTPLYRDSIALSVEGNKIVIEVESSVSPRLVSQAYMLVAKHLAKLGSRVRMSKRVSELQGFVWANRGLPWSQRWRKWNKEHPEWRYKSVNSMQVVWSRNDEIDRALAVWSSRAKKTKEVGEHERG